MSSKKECACGKIIWMTSSACSRCSLRARLAYFANDDELTRISIVDIGELLVDIVSFNVYDKASRIRYPLKFRINFPCIRCTSKFKTSAFCEVRKKHQWHCQACATSLQWKDTTYKEKHVKAIIEASAKPESRAKRRACRAKINADPDFIKRMSEIQRKAWQDPILLARHSAILKARFFENPPKCISKRTPFNTGKKQIILRSSYEYTFANYLESQNYEWEYENKAYILRSYHDRSLLPDFYVKDLDLVIEIKGYMWKDAREKWLAFCNEYPQIRKVILFKDDIKKLTLGELHLEDYIKEDTWQTACLRLDS